MRVAVLGNGSIGKRHARNLHALGYRVSLIDSNPDVTSEAAGELDLVLDQCDAAIVCVPTAFHLRIFKKCLEHNLPVYLEKPACSIRDIPELEDIAQRTDLPTIMVGYQLRYHRDIIALHKRTPFEFARLSCECDMQTWQGVSSRGNFILEMSHEIDLALHLGAGPLCSFSNVNGQSKQVRMGFDGGFSVHLNGASPEYRRSWDVTWPSQLKWPSAGHQNISGPGLYTTISPEQIRIQYPTPERLGNTMYVNAMRSFMALAETRRQPSRGCTLQQAIDVMKIVQEVDYGHATRTR